MEQNGATLSDFLAVGKEIEVECVAHIIVGNETDLTRKIFKRNFGLIRGYLC